MQPPPKLFSELDFNFCTDFNIKNRLSSQKVNNTVPLSLVCSSSWQLLLSRSLTMQMASFWLLGDQVIAITLNILISPPSTLAGCTKVFKSRNCMMTKIFSLTETIPAFSTLFSPRLFLNDRRHHAAIAINAPRQHHGRSGSDVLGMCDV